jgi:hypothetical protein
MPKPMNPRIRHVRGLVAVKFAGWPVFYLHPDHVDQFISDQGVRDQLRWSARDARSVGEADALQPESIRGETAIDEIKESA